MNVINVEYKKVVRVWFGFIVEYSDKIIKGIFCYVDRVVLYYGIDS